MAMQAPSRETARPNILAFRRARASNRTIAARARADANAHKHEHEHEHEHAMSVLGQIGAIICHEPGAKPDTSILTKLAARPAEGFWAAIARMNALDANARRGVCPLTARKRREIARLMRTLAQPLPRSTPAGAQAAFWTAYCTYWDALLRTHVRRESHNRQDLAS
jgi:hypothetical protein